MRPTARRGALAAVGLVVGICAGMAIATVSTAASSQVCVGVVVDDGSGGSPTPQAAQVSPGTTDLQALNTAGDTATQNSSGLVCALNGYPANGLQNCTSVSGGQYYYWSYWQGDPYSNTWTYAPVGPASHAVGAGQTYVEGWRYQNPGPDNASAPKPAVTPAAAYAAACPGVAPAPPSTGGSGSAGGGSTGGASGPGAAGSSAGPPSVPVAPTTQPTSGAATSPAKATTGPSRSTPKAAGTGATTTSPGGAGAPGTPSGSTGTGATTTTPTGASKGKGHTAAAALASSTPHGGTGGSPLLPLLLVAAAIIVIGALTLYRWRRRPAGE